MRQEIADPQPSRLEGLESGFSLIELPIVLLIFSVLTTTAVILISQANKNVQSSLGSSGLNAEGLAALGQMTREIRTAGFPSVRSYTAAAVLAHPGIVATPFTTASSYDLVFQGDINGDGRVEQIEYSLAQGSTTIVRVVTPINSDGTPAASMQTETVLLSNVQNQLQGIPLFTWDVNASSAAAFPLNIRTVYIKAVLSETYPTANQPTNLTLMASCQRLSP